MKIEKVPSIKPRGQDCSHKLVDDMIISKCSDCGTFISRKITDDDFHITLRGDKCKNIFGAVEIYDLNLNLIYRKYKSKKEYWYTFNIKGEHVYSKCSDGDTWDYSDQENVIYTAYSKQKA